MFKKANIYIPLKTDVKKVSQKKGMRAEIDECC